MVYKCAALYLVKVSAYNAWNATKESVCHGCLGKVYNLVFNHRIPVITSPPCSTSTCKSVDLESMIHLYIVGLPLQKWLELLGNTTRVSERCSVDEATVVYAHWCRRQAGFGWASFDACIIFLSTNSNVTQFL